MEYLRKVDVSTVMTDGISVLFGAAQLTVTQGETTPLFIKRSKLATLLLMKAI